MENENTNKNAAYVVMNTESGTFFLIDGREIGEMESLANATFFDDLDFAREMRDQQNMNLFEDWADEEGALRGKHGWRTEPYRWLHASKQNLEDVLGSGGELDEKDLFGPWVLKKVVLTTHFVD